MLEALRKKLADALTERKAAQDAMDGVLETVGAEKRSDMTPEETVAFDEARSKATALDADIADLQARIGELEDVAKRSADATELAASLVPGAATGPQVRVGSEPLTYRKGGEHSFIADAYNAQYGNDFRAAERIQRHSAEMAVEYRATTTAAYTTGLVIPQFMADDFAPFARAGRVTMNAIGSTDLPDDGMQINVPRLTTSTAAAVQATQNTAVNLQDPAATLLSVNVNTYAGQAQVARQAVERGRGIDNILFGDLIADYAVKVNTDVVNGAGTGGTHLGILNIPGINAVTFTSGSPTLALLFSKVADAIQRVATTRFMAPSHIIMHPRRWAWCLAALDTTNRPLITTYAGGTYNAAAESDKGLDISDGPVGNLLGVDVYVDATIPTNLGGGTNEDRVIVAYLPDHRLYEQPGSPLSLRFEEVLGASLTVQLVVFGYSAYAGGRYPGGISVISGTGLVTPTF